jgi:hypothetical protein
MSEYTAMSTTRVRESFIYAQLHAQGRNTNEIDPAIGAGFDEWLASVEADAWDEGRDCTGPYPVNPNRGVDDE